jgi:hypothetical protein
VPHHPDINALLNELLPFAERMLREQGEFYPFGGSITPDGKHISVGAKGSCDQPPSREIIDIMTDAFRRQAAEGKIRAAGICFDVRVVPPGQVDKTDAIELCLERAGGDAVEVFVPYALLPNGEITYGDMFASTRTPTMFVEHQKT